MPKSIRLTADTAAGEYALDSNLTGVAQSSLISWRFRVGPADTCALAGHVHTSTWEITGELDLYSGAIQRYPVLR